LILCSVSSISSLTEEEKHKMREVSDSVFFTDDIEKIPYEKINILVTYGYDIDNNLLRKMPSLKWIHIFQTGIEHIPVKEILNKEILLTHTKDVHGIPISEYVLGMILYTLRDMQRFISNKNNKVWDKGLPLNEAYGRNVTIFGTGSIGSEIAKLLKKIDMHIIGINRTGKPKEHFDEVFKMERRLNVINKSDFIVLIMPATEETYHCISENEFQAMSEQTFLINIGRGSLIDTKALIKNLIRGKIKGAALDVFEKEPLSNDSPLWHLDNLFITPHISSYTDKYNLRCIQEFIKNYSLFKAGKKLRNRVINI